MSNRASVVVIDGTTITIRFFARIIVDGRYKSAYSYPAASPDDVELWICSDMNREQMGLVINIGLTQLSCNYRAEATPKSCGLFDVHPKPRNMSNGRQH